MTACTMCYFTIMYAITNKHNLIWIQMTFFHKTFRKFCFRMCLYIIQSTNLIKIAFDIIII